MPSVLQDWLADCSLRKQSAVLLAMRGPDGVPRESSAKNVIRHLRAVVMHEALNEKPDVHGATWYDGRFMRCDHFDDDFRWENMVNGFLNEIDMYPVHFVQHLMLATAVVANHHADELIANRFDKLYTDLCSKFSAAPLTPDTLDTMLADKPE